MRILWRRFIFLIKSGHFDSAADQHTIFNGRKFIGTGKWYIMKIKKIFNPNYVLIFFILFVVVFILVNYIGDKFLEMDKYTYEKLVKTFGFLCFVPGTMFFLGISIYNYSIAKTKNDKRSVRISLIPLCLILLYYFYVFIMVFYAFIRDIDEIW